MGNGLRDTGRGTGRGTGRAIWTGDLCIPRHGFHLKSTPGNVAKPWEGSGENWAMRWDYAQVALCGVYSACVKRAACAASRRVLPSPVLWGMATLAVVRCQVTALWLRCGDASVGPN